MADWITVTWLLSVAAEEGPPYVAYEPDFVRTSYDKRTGFVRHLTAPHDTARCRKSNVRHRTEPVRQRTTYDTARNPYDTARNPYDKRNVLIKAQST